MMMYEALLTMRLPGNSPEDAKARLARCLPPGWGVEFQEIYPLAAHPTPIVGTVEIKLDPLQIERD